MTVNVRFQKISIPPTDCQWEFLGGGGGGLKGRNFKGVWGVGHVKNLQCPKNFEIGSPFIKNLKMFASNVFFLPKNSLSSFGWLVYKPHSCISRTQNFQAWFQKKKKTTPKSTRLVKKVRYLFADVSNKLDEICISSDINKLINFENTFWKLLFNQFPYSL